MCKRPELLSVQGGAVLGKLLRPSKIKDATHVGNGKKQQTVHTAARAAKCDGAIVVHA